MAKKALVLVTLVPVALVHERPVMVPLAEVRASINALEALRLVVVTPPKKVTATDVVAPRAVTLANVSASPAITGQFEPSLVQTSKPFTRICVEDTSVAKRFVVETLVNVAFELRSSVILPEFAIKEPMVPLVV